MSTMRTIKGVSAAAVMLSLTLLPGCKDSTVPGTAAGERGPLGMVTSEHGLMPDYHGLVKEYRSMLAEDPHNLAANIALGNALYDAGQWKEAIRYYDQSLQLNPHNADVVTDRGTCYRNLGMIDEAVRDYQQALRIEPAHQEALFNLGTVYSHDKKDLARAVEYWERLLKVAPKHPQADYIHATLDNFRRSMKKGAS